MLHLHHKIPRSRGGTDDEWNLVEWDDYTHAYEHALDFVLFYQAPRFDFRQSGWNLLPEELRKAVLEETSRRFSEKNLSWVKKGEHPMQQERNRQNQSERTRELWESEEWRENNKDAIARRAETLAQQNAIRLANGTHNFAGEEAKKRASEQQLKKVEEGTHPWKTKEHSETVSKRFKGAKHWVNEEGEVRFSREKPEGNWINGRKWKHQ
jgi:hypothetical protein